MLLEDSEKSITIVSRITGSVRGSLSTETFSSLLLLLSFRSEGKSHMIEKDYTNKNELITEIYQYSKWNIERLQDLNKKVESRILASLAFAGVGIKIASDLFNNLDTNQKEILSIIIVVKFLIIGILVLAGFNFLEAVKVKKDKDKEKNSVESPSIKGIDESFEKFNDDKYKFQNSITVSWVETERNLAELIDKKSKLLNNGIQKILWSGGLYGVGIILENIVKAYF